jgi:tetratricopeptide (TPR) repeat protein
LAVKLRPDLIDASSYYIMGASYHALKKYSEAVKTLQQGIYVLRAAKVGDDSTQTRPMPSLFQFKYNLGVTYQSMGSNFEAIKTFREAASLNPEAAEPHYGLALVYLTMGDRASVEREQRILRTLNTDLAKKVGEALASRTLYIPPGCTALPCP